MRISAGESITQSIPIINETTSPWNMKIYQETNKPNANWFAYDQGMHVGANSAANYSITFKPRWMDTA